MKVETSVGAPAGDRCAAMSLERQDQGDGPRTTKARRAVSSEAGWVMVHGKGRSPSIMEREAGLGSLQLHLESSGGDGEEKDFNFNAKGARRKLKVTSFPKQGGKLGERYHLVAVRKVGPAVP